MRNNQNGTNYGKKFTKKKTKKEPTLHTISVELKKTPNILYNNYQNYNNNQIKIINVTNNNSNSNQINHGKNKIFKNIKLYDVSKHQNFIKKRKLKTKKVNSIPGVSFTEINTNIKKSFSINNTHINQNNHNLNNFNNTINLYHKNYHSNNKNIIKINKSLNKSKSNKIFLTAFKHNYNIHSRNKNININTALIKSNTNSGYNRSFNNSNNKKLINSKINKYHINFSPAYTNHTISMSTQKNSKFNENRAKLVEDKIQKLIKEKENKEKEIKLKDKIIKEQENIINLLKQNEITLKEQNKIINDKYEDIKNNYENINNENKILKDKLYENEKIYKEKELKLMRILYLLKEKGIDINSILNEVKNESNNESLNKIEANEDNKLNNSSNLTIYFPDKVNMKNIMETKGAENIPKIDFNQVPDYSFQSEEEKQNNNNDDDEMPNQDEFNYNNNYNDNEFNNYGLNAFHRNSF